MEFFTSDTHFGHSNIMKFCPKTRLGASIEEHDEILIQNWNSQVRPGDTVYHLGDFAFCSRGRLHEILKQLNGRIHMIMGNHDQMFAKGDYDQYLASRQDYREIKLNKTKVCLFHFPMFEWNQCHRGSFHLFGHVHDTYGTVRGKSLNVGIDNRREADMLLWTWDEIVDFMDKQPLIEHH